MNHATTFTRQTLARLTCAAALGCGLLASNAQAHSITWSTASIVERNNFKTELLALRDAHEEVDEITFTSGGQWVIVADDTVRHSSGFPAAVLGKIESYIASGREIDVVAFTSNGSWVVVAEDYLWRSGGLPHSNELRDRIKSRQNAGKRIDEVALTNTGWVVVSGSWVVAKSVPSKLYSALVERGDSKRRIHNISIGSDGRWAVVADQWFASDDLSTGMVNSLRMWQRTERKLEHAVVAPGNSYVLYGGAYSPDLDSPIARIEYDLGATGKNIYQRMNDLDVQGLSIAVIDNNQVRYARGYGTLEASTQRWVRPDSPFYIGSTSKLVATVGALRLHETDDLPLGSEIGDLDGAVSAWIAYGTTYPEVFDTHADLPLDIDIAQLLSHTANLNNGSTTIPKANYEGSDDVSTLYALLGYDCDPGCEVASEVTAWYDPNIGNGIPGDSFQYSNKGFLVTQAAAEAATGQGFPDLMSARVLGPLGMSDSLYDQYPSSSYRQRTAVRHDNAGNPLGWNMIPNYAAGGLLTTPNDYAKLMIMLMRGGTAEWFFTLPGSAPVPVSYQFLSEDSVAEIVTDRRPGSREYGLGVELSGDIFTHGGEVGGSGSCMQGHLTRGEGIFIAVNSSFSNAKPLLTEIRKAFREAFGWTDYEPNFSLSC